VGLTPILDAIRRAIEFRGRGNPLASRVEGVLNTLPAQLAAIQDAYGKDLQAHEVSDDLLHKVCRLIEDCQRVLVWTATDLDHEFGQARERSPYFPLRLTPGEFAGAMAQDFPKVPSPVLDAMERNQPYK